MGFAKIEKLFIVKFIVFDTVWSQIIVVTLFIPMFGHIIVFEFAYDLLNTGIG